MSSAKLTDIIRRATKCEDITVGKSVKKPEFGFLNYPIAWCQHMEKLTGLLQDRDVLPAYLTLVMHVNTTVFSGKLVPNLKEPSE